MICSSLLSNHCRIAICSIRSQYNMMVTCTQCLFPRTAKLSHKQKNIVPKRIMVNLPVIRSCIWKLNHWFSGTFTIRDDYAANMGTNTWRLRRGLKNHHKELLDDAVSKITCILYYSMWDRIWIIKRSFHTGVRKQSVYGLVYEA
jgi:hypothetical protein